MRPQERVIYHIDCNSFFASVSLLYKPWLKDYPVVVGGDEEARHGIVLAKNEAAKKYKIPTGSALWEARRRCPGLRVIPPEYDKYARFSREIHEYLSQYSDLLEPFGSDECWLDVTNSHHLFGGPQGLAEKIRADIPRYFGITVSIGVSWNKIFAKLGSDMKKPNGLTYITRTGPQDTAWQGKVYPLPVEELLYVGHATQRKLYNKGVYTIGDLAAMGEKLLVEWFGKVGTSLYLFASGQDAMPVCPIGAAPIVKTIGNSCTTPRDLHRPEEIRQTLTQLCETTCRRMREHGAMATTCCVSARKQQGRELNGCMKQHKLDLPLNTTVDFARECHELMGQLLRPGDAVRSLGVRGAGLISADTPYQCQLGVDVYRNGRLQRLDKARDAINARFGKTCVVQARSIQDKSLLGLGTKVSQDFAPNGYFG